MKLDQQQNQDPNQIWIIALPKFQAQAADFTEVDVILDAKELLPLYMQVWMPNRSHHTYIFDIETSRRTTRSIEIQARIRAAERAVWLEARRRKSRRCSRRPAAPQTADVSSRSAIGPRKSARLAEPTRF